MFEIDKVTATDIKNIAFCQHLGGMSAQTQNRVCYGFSFCAGGHITFKIGNELIELTPNSAVLLPYNASYSWLCHKSGLFPQINFISEKPLTERIERFELGNYALFDGKLKELQNALITSSKAKAMSIFYDILDSIGRKNRGGHGILTKSIDHLLQSYSDPELSNAVLAEQSGISEVYFRKLFKEHFGVTPKQYILDLRIKKACRLLSENQYNVSEIAEQCGFSSVYHFCRAFKSFTALTPTEYAKQNENYSQII